MRFSPALTRDTQTSWYTYISPRDQTFVNAVRNTTLASLESILSDRMETQERRNDHQDSLYELIFTTAPTIFERHVKAYRGAKEDIATLQREGMTTQIDERPSDAPQDGAQSDPSRSISALAQRYQLYAPHPGMRVMTRPLNDTEASAPMTPTATREVEIRRPPKGRAIDESLADALSSSITALPPLTIRGGSSGVVSSTQNQTDRATDYYGFSSSQSYEASPEYLSSLANHFLKRHLPQQDYASRAERTMVNEVLGNAVLGNVLRKCSEPSFIWRLGLSLIEDERVTRDQHSRVTPECNEALKQETQPLSVVGILTTLQNSTTIPIARYFDLFIRVLKVITATCLYAMATSVTTFLQASQADLQSGGARSNEKGRAGYLCEPWLEASIAWISAGSTFATRESWMIGKMGYIACSRTIDKWVCRGLHVRAALSDRLKSLTKDVFERTLDVDSAAWAIAKLTDTLFPDGDLAPSIPDPSPEEAEQMRRDLERRVYNRVPGESKLVER